MEATSWARHADMDAEQGKTLNSRILKFADLLRPDLDHLADLKPSISKLPALGINGEHAGRKPSGQPPSAGPEERKQRLRRHSLGAGFQNRTEDRPEIPGR